MINTVFDIRGGSLIQVFFRTGIWLRFLNWVSVVIVINLGGCVGTARTDEAAASDDQPVELVVLGIAQDGGYPQAGCLKPCCQRAWADPELRRWVSCVAIVDHETGQRFLLDCTPDFPSQLQWLEQNVPLETRTGAKLDGILLTHAHIGHYTGLMNLGREVMGTKDVPVFAMPRMLDFLKKNGPWSQLIELSNIKLQPMMADQAVQLNTRISVVPILVPHRDEFSETVAFVVVGPHKKALYLPDIDKWSRWDRSIEKIIGEVDVAYIDGTFLANGELPGRDMSLIPHPFIQESINRFAPLDEAERKKVRFIHLNHTNPALQKDSSAQRQIRQAGMAVAQQGEKVSL